MQDDVGWDETYMQYYLGTGPLSGRNVSKVLQNVVAALLEDPARRFTYVGTIGRVFRVCVRVWFNVCVLAWHTLHCTFLLPIASASISLSPRTSILSDMV